MSVSKWAYTPEVCDGKYCVGDCDRCSLIATIDVLMEDNKFTAADVVEVVRCKDCKHYVLHTLFGRTQGWCERLCDKFDKSLAHGTKGDDYCSHGERADT